MNNKIYDINDYEKNDSLSYAVADKNDDGNAEYISGVSRNIENVDVGEDAKIEKNEIIGRDEIHEALRILNRYKSDRSVTDSRIINNQKWWRLRNWDSNKNKSNSTDPKPNSAWLVSMLMNKHADAMDCFPSPNVTPRASDDEESAKILSNVIPCILDDCRYKKVWSSMWWDKLISGVGIIGVFWNPKKNNIGDIDVINIDPLSFYSDPRVENIQHSRHVFTCARYNREALIDEYPFLEDKEISSSSFTMSEYVNDDNQNDDTDSVTVIDWYYKRDGILNYCKFCGDTVLFSSENEGYAEGYYAHGQYPFIVDNLYPLKNSPYGLGFVDRCGDTQAYIDALDNAILKNTLANARPRYFVKEQSGVNSEDFADFTKEIIPVAGNGVGEEAVRPVQSSQLPGICFSVLQHKITELKETTANNDFSRGSTASGVTSGSAIAALQEAGNKVSRDMISASFTCFEELCYLILELIREFYKYERTYRISGGQGEEEKYISFSGENISGVPQNEFGYDVGDRVPIFDIKVCAQKSSSFSREIQNQRAQELYQLGFFNPENAQNALACLAMMDFEGKDKMERIISKNFKQNEIMKQMSNEIAELRRALGESSQQGAPAQNEQGTIPGRVASRNIAENSLGETVDKTNSHAAEAMRRKVQNGASPNV